MGLDYSRSMLLSFSRAAFGERARTTRSVDSAQREKARLQAVARFARVGPAGLAAARSAAQVAAALLDAEVGLCTLVEERVVRVLGSVGLDGVAELPREPGLCVAAVGSGRPRIVERADLDRRTCEHSLVRGPARVRSYAGVPMLTADGFEVGTVAAASLEHRVPATRALAALEALADLVVSVLEAEPPPDPALDPVSTLPARRRFVERLALLARAQAWERNWGAVLALDVDGLDALEARGGAGASEAALRALSARLRERLGADGEAFAFGAGRFAVIAGLAANFDPAPAIAQLEAALREVADMGFAELRGRVGVATYDECATPGEAYRLADWRAYAEKIGRR